MRPVSEVYWEMTSEGEGPGTRKRSMMPDSATQ